MLKLNEIAKNNTITAYGFKAFIDYAAHSQGDNHVVVSTLSPAVMAEMGIKSYYAPVLPRNTVFNTAEDITQANLDTNFVTVLAGFDDSLFDNVTIVSRHQGTIALLLDKYPNATVLSGNVTADDINRGFVVGTLPPHLIQFCKSYSAVTINDFDYAKDGDLSGLELEDRIHICNPISVKID